MILNLLYCFELPLYQRKHQGYSLLTKIIKTLLLCLVLMQQRRKILFVDMLTTLQKILQMLQWDEW